MVASGTVGLTKITKARFHPLFATVKSIPSLKRIRLCNSGITFSLVS